MEAIIYKENLEIPVGDIRLPGELLIPENATGIIVFSHGSGSNRLSPSNNYVANILRNEGFATLLFDLLTKEEGLDYEMRFDISLMTDRLEMVTNWVIEDSPAKDLYIGFYGASSGAASALSATTRLGDKIKAIVSRSGRPDLAMQQLLEVEVPTLLIVGRLDENVAQLNRSSLRHLAGVRKLAIVPGATHFFSEPGKLDEVAQLSANWYQKYLK